MFFSNISEFSITCKNHRVTQHAVETFGQDSTHDVTVEIDSSKDALILDITGKQQADTLVSEQGDILDDAWVEIRSVWVDGILMEPWALARLGVFHPVYSQSHKDYARDHGLALEAEITDSVRWHFNGAWHMELGDFFQRYHGILTSGFQNYNKWIRISHLGMVDPRAYQELTEILEQLNQ